MTQMQDKELLEPSVRAFPIEADRARITPTAWVMSLAGLALVVIGAGTLVGTNWLPELTGVDGWLETRNVGADSVVLAGLILFGVGQMARYMRVHANTLLKPGALSNAVQEVGADIAEFREKIYEFQADHIHFRNELEGVRRDVRDASSKDRSSEAHDALFRLAASLDQLHALIDQRIGESTTTVQALIFELSGLVEASRDYLQETLEEQGKQGSAIAERLAYLAQDLHTLDARAHGSAGAYDPYREAPAQRLQPIRDHYEPEAAEIPVDDFERADEAPHASTSDELSILVDLEHGLEEQVPDELADDGPLGLLGQVADDDPPSPPRSLHMPGDGTNG
ncbi:MAG: hypothetical protein GY711_28840 [bacterium]|nr:hypothetical protein [bacterium]